MSDDNNETPDNVAYLNFKPKNIDRDAYQYFLSGAQQHAAYQESEAIASACMTGIMNVIERKLGGIKHDGVYGDAAVIGVLLQGVFMRQVGVECPEIHLLDDIREILAQKVKS